MNKFKITKEMNKLLVDSGSKDPAVSQAATRELGQALQEPLRAGVQSGDIKEGIFETVVLAPDAAPEFPLDLLRPGTEKDHVAYTIPNAGRIPEKHVEGDYVMIPTYEVGGSIDWLLRYPRHARWDVIRRALEVLQGSFIKKDNDDAWHVLLTAGVDRNILVYDGDASAGQFTKRLVSLMKTIMRRNGGGNSASNNRGLLTDLFVSPEAIEDMRDWKVDQVDEITRREIYVAQDGMLNRIFSVNLRDIDELGASQEYQNFFTNELSGSLASGDSELVVGLDLSKNDSFYNPVKQELEIFDDPTLHRQRRQGYYGWKEQGWGALDNRRLILGSF
jgi:hypothetical protein